jgi:hypothetical protein
MGEDTVTHADQIDALFPIVFATVDMFHSEGIEEGLGCLMERQAMLAPIGGSLVFVPFKFRRNGTTDCQ